MTLSYFLSQIYQQDSTLKPYEQYILAYLKENLVGKKSFVVDQNFLSALRVFIATIQEEENKKQEQENQEKKHQESIGDFAQEEFLEVSSQDSKCVDQNMQQNDQKNNQKEKKTDIDMIQKISQKQRSKLDTEEFFKSFYKSYKRKYFFGGFFLGIFFLLLVMLYHFFAPRRGLSFMSFYDMINKVSKGSKGFVFFHQDRITNVDQVVRENTKNFCFSGFTTISYDDIYFVLCQKSFCTGCQEKSLFHLGLRDEKFFYKNLENVNITLIKTGKQESICDFRFSGKVFTIPLTGIAIDISSKTPFCFLVPLETNVRKILSFAQKLAPCPLEISSGKQQYFFSTPIFTYKKYYSGSISYLIPIVKFSLFDYSGILLQEVIDVYLPKGFYGTGWY